MLRGEKMYHIFLNNHGMLKVVKTNAYDKKVEDILKWCFGNSYSVMMVVKDGEVIFAQNFTIDTKEEILEEVEFKSKSYWWDEEGEELQEKIEFLISILV